MKSVLNILKTYPISCILIIFIWVMCFGTPPATPLDNVTLIDKWVHAGMFAFLGIIMWIEYLRKHSTVIRKKLIILAWLMSVLMGGAIEIIQAYCTGGRRSGEFLDFVADAIGVTLSFAFGIIWVKYLSRKKRDSD